MCSLYNQGYLETMVSLDKIFIAHLIGYCPLEDLVLVAVSLHCSFLPPLQTLYQRHTSHGSRILKQPAQCFFTCNRLVKGLDLKCLCALELWHVIVVECEEQHKQL